MHKAFPFHNTNLSYRDTGTGQPVVLIHGFGEDSEVFDDQVDFLKPHCRVIVPDLPGSGLSVGNWQLEDGSMPPYAAHFEPNSIESMAEAVLQVIHHAQAENCIVLGHSMGGYITLALAEILFALPAGDIKPTIIKAIGLLHSTALPDSEDKKTSRRKAIAFIQKNGAYAFLQTAIPDMFAQKFKDEHSDRIKTLVENGKHFTPEALIAYYEAMIARPDRTQVLKDSEVPVLFILGKEDKAVKLEDTMPLVSMPKASHFHILEEVAHMGMWEATETFNQYLLDFIEKV